MIKPAYYNENDEFAARWLRNLIKAGHIAPGDVDQRSIEDVRAEDLKGYTQCHFFAGVGVWSHALRRTGWRDDSPVWTASCPCQPFSEAGKNNGFADERHLWPALFHLVEVMRPGLIFGEQVASQGGLEWVDLVRSDMEDEGYAFAALDLCAAGFGAPHIRQRLYWVADGTSEGLERGPVRSKGVEPQRATAQRGCPAGWLAVAEHGGLPTRVTQRARPGAVVPPSASGGPGQTNGPWSGADWLYCRDGKWRPVEPGTSPLAHGAASRVGRLRAYGNAICAEVAEQFIRAWLEATL